MAIRIVDIISPYKAILNCGSKDGVNKGDIYLVYGLSKPIKDIETGEDLGCAELIRGRGIVVHVQDKICTIESCEYEPPKKTITKRTRSDFYSISAVDLATGNTGNVIVEESDGEKRKKQFEGIQIGDYAKR